MSKIKWDPRNDEPGLPGYQAGCQRSGKNKMHSYKPSIGMSSQNMTGQTIPLSPDHHAGVDSELGPQVTVGTGHDIDWERVLECYLWLGLGLGLGLGIALLLPSLV